MRRTRVATGIARATMVLSVSLFATGLGVAQPVSVTMGLDVRAVTGTFGSQQTSTLVYVPASLRVDVGRVESSLAFPYLNIHDGTVAVSQAGFVPMRGSLTGAPGAGVPMGAGHGGGMMGAGTSAGSPPGSSPSPGALPQAWLTNGSGLGDLVGSVGYRVVENTLSGVGVVVGTRIKLPTASSVRGLGTGKADVGAFMAFRKRFSDGWLHAEVGYLRVGDPAGVELRDAAFWSLGGGRRLSPRTSLIVSGAGNTAILPEFGAPLEIGAGLGVLAGEQLTLAVVPSIGLTKASPRVALTFGISRRVFDR